ncbi:MAG: hypothetical protein AAGJ35_01110 [Myxococcota bacterium]
MEMRTPYSSFRDETLIGGLLRRMGFIFLAIPLAAFITVFWFYPLYVACFVFGLVASFCAFVMLSVKYKREFRLMLAEDLREKLKAEGWQNFEQEMPSSWSKEQRRTALKLQKYIEELESRTVSMTPYKNFMEEVPFHIKDALGILHRSPSPSHTHLTSFGK